MKADRSILAIIGSIILFNLILINLIFSKQPDKLVLTPNYWLSINNNNIILSLLQIKTQNIAAINNQTNIKYPVTNLKTFPLMLSKQTLTQLLSYAPKQLYNTTNNQLLEYSFFEKIAENVNIRALNNNNSVQYAITIKHSAVKSIPTHVMAYQNLSLAELNYFQETIIAPLETVIILHYTMDRKWVFVQSSNYYGWVEKENLLLLQKTRWLTYINLKEKDDQIIVVTTPNYIFNGMVFTMGDTIPFKLINNIPYAIIPQVGSNNNYFDKQIIINMNDINNDLIHFGYVTFTPNNIIKYVFRYLDYPYAVGGLDNYGNYGVDSSSLVQKVYKIFAITVPRNSGDQEQYKFSNNLTLLDKSNSERYTYLQENSQAGDILFLKEHALIYLGNHKKSLYAIHAVYAMGNKTKNNKVLELPVHKVIISNLNDLKENGKSLLEELTSVTFLSYTK